jgi:hypothetical protein
MPKCKYCGQSITKFDKEICPYCGGKNPIDSSSPETMDITESIKTVTPTDEVRVKFKPKKRNLNAVLCMFLGVFGIDELYLGFKNRFLIRLAINAVAYIAFVLIFYFSNKSAAPLYIFFLPFLIVFGVWFVIGIIFLFIKNKKDSNGVFLI